MWRFLVGGVAALLMAGAGVLIWSSLASRDTRIPPPPAAVMAPVAAVAPNAVAIAEPPQATELTREQKRFSRADHDKDGKIELAEYLQARHRNFDKLDAITTAGSASTNMRPRARRSSRAPMPTSPARSRRRSSRRRGWCARPSRAARRPPSLGLRSRRLRRGTRTMADRPMRHPGERRDRPGRTRGAPPETPAFAGVTGCALR